MGPRQLSVSVINSTFSNTPPSITSLSFTTHEDVTLTSVTVTYHDPDGDLLEFSLVNQGVKGVANITQDGELTYRPQQDFNGDDVIKLTGTCFSFSELPSPTSRGSLELRF